MYDVNKELADYLKTKQGLNRLIIKLKEKYIVSSKTSGIITLKNLTEKEKEDISNLLGKNVNEDILKTSFKEITKKINEGKYKNFNFEKLLNNYFKGNIITKAKQKEINTLEKNDFYNKFYIENQDKKHLKDLKNIIEKEEDINKLIKQKYRKNKEGLRKELENILLLLENIPENPEPLAVYASNTGNPHYLDLNKNTCSLFLKILAKLKNIEYENNTETKINVLSEINVYTDPLSNFVITYKLEGNKILNELSKHNEIVNLNLLNIKNIKNITTKSKKVYIFENPSILTALKDLNVPIIITSGIPNLSLYNVLDKLTKNNIQLYYNGDFDPEGLIIAEKLKQKYPNLKLICYEKIDYQNSKSQEKISESRLKKLENIKAEDLQKIKNILLKEYLAGYQEQNLNKIAEYMQNK